MTAHNDWKTDLKLTWRAVLICAFVTLAAFQFGYDSSYYSGILAMQPFLKIYGDWDPTTGEYFMSASKQSLTTSIINAGEFVGAVSAYLVGDKVGRRGGLFVSSACVIVGTVIQVASTHIASLIVGRLVLGYAVGLISCFVPLYVADCAPARFRGALVCMYQFCLGQGLLLGVIVDYCTEGRSDTGAFRIPMAVQFIFPIIVVPGLLLFVPESPIWLMSKGRVEDARRSLERLNGPHNSALTENELADLQVVFGDAEVRKTGSWRSVFTEGPEQRKAYLGCALQALQQGTGVNFVTGYGIVFFIAIGIKNAFLIQLGLYLVGMPAIWIAQYSIEKYGRRPLLIVSGLLTAAVLLVEGSVGVSGDTSMAASQVIVAMVYLFLVVFNIAWGPLPWVLTSELATGPNRGQLMSLSTGTNWFFTWLVSFTFPYLFDADAADLGARVGFIYGALTLAAVVWVWFLLPETAGRSLEEIHTLFNNRVPARKFKSTIIELPSTEIEDVKVYAKAEHDEYITA